MANPNIIAVTHIFGNTSTTSLTTTSNTCVVTNGASSGKIYKLNTIMVSNNDSVTAYPVTISIYDVAGTLGSTIQGNAFALANTISVPGAASLIVLDKSTSIYLMENKSIGATAATANKLQVTCSWDEIDAA